MFKRLFSRRADAAPKAMLEVSTKEQLIAALSRGENEFRCVGEAYEAAVLAMRYLEKTKEMSRYADQHPEMGSFIGGIYVMIILARWIFENAGKLKRLLSYYEISDEGSDYIILLVHRGIG